MESWNVGWDILKDSKIQTILIVGCGGGFDFVHSLLIYDDLIQLGKRVIIGSYSFGNPLDYSQNSQLEPILQANVKDSNYNDRPVIVKVTSNSIGSEYYCPEFGYCSYLDSKYPEKDPHYIYAYYARSFTIKSLSKFYSQLIQLHSIDAIIAVDGGSDSLMKGDEDGLGDPIEDAVSVGAIASLCLDVQSYQDSLKQSVIPLKPLGLLYSIGLGCDRFNFVSDASSLRSIAELNQSNGFLGSFSFISTSARVRFYQEGLNHIYQRQQMRSILSGSILASSLGYFGNDLESLNSSNIDFGTRLSQSNTSGIPSSEELYLWPLMSMIWMFDITVVTQRSLICQWISQADTTNQAIELFNNGRRALAQQNKIRKVEYLPRPRMQYSSPLDDQIVAPIDDTTKSKNKCNIS